MTTDSDPVIALSLLCRYRLTQLGSELASRLLLVQSGEQEGAERLAERRVPLLPPGAHLASPEPVAATRKRKSRKKSTSAVPESPTAVESSLSTYPTSSYRSTITTSPTLSTSTQDASPNSNLIYLLLPGLWLGHYYHLSQHNKTAATSDP